MNKQKSISSPKVGMNRSTSPHLLSEGEFSFQLNGASYDEGGEKFNLTDEHSNILASKFKEGFKFIGGKNHIVRNKTYIFLTNPDTSVSEIGCIVNNSSFFVEKDKESVSNCTNCSEYTNIEATPLEKQLQQEHQVYETLLEDSCNLCLGFDIEHPIVDIVIKEQNIGTRLFWTSTPGNKELRSIELDNIEQYKTTGDDSCGEIPTDTCLDCDKLRVFRLYEELKIKDYKRSLGGNLKKGSYEILGAYSDRLGNEFTSYISLTPIIPIFDEANIIHEQEDNNAETNFSIQVELDTVDNNFDFYKIVVRHYISKGVFVSFVEGVHNISDKSIIISNNEGESINNTRLSLVKPFVETVDGITASNNTLFLNGIREREPINLQPVVSLMGLGVRWMSFRAKEDLYSSADSYKYIGYNRDENVALSIDFGFIDGYRTNPFVFIPRPATPLENEEISSGDDYESIINVVGDCDGNSRTKRWQFYNTAFEIGPCPLSEEIETVSQIESVVTYSLSEIPSVPAGSITVPLDEIDFFDFKEYIQSNLDTCNNPNSSLNSICPFVDLNSLTSFNNPPQLQGECEQFDLLEESIIISETINETIIFNRKPLDEYSLITPPRYCDIHNIDPTGDRPFLIDEDFSYRYNVTSYSSNNPSICSLERKPEVFNINCQSSEELTRVTQEALTNSSYSGHYHLNSGSDGVETTSGSLVIGKEYIIYNLEEGQVFPDDFSNVGYVEEGTSFIATGETPNVWENETVVLNITDSIASMLSDKESEASEGFYSFVHKNAIWFRTTIDERERFLIEIPRKSDCTGDCVSVGDNIRLTFFDKCSDTTPIFTTIVDLSSHTFIDLDVINNTINGEPLDFSFLLSDTIYIAVDVPIVQSLGYGSSYDPENPDFSLEPTTQYRSAPICGCFSIVDRAQENSSVTVFFDEIVLNKSQKYSTECTFEVPVLKDCEPVPFKYGELGYYESTEKYGDNEELYDSSKLLISKSRITSQELLEKIEAYRDGENENLIFLSEDADFRCKPIRHYKLPDNQVSPFINTNTIASNSDAVISPLGFTIDGEIINNLLDVAVDNELLTQNQRNNIVNYKIYRSDSSLDRSVVASGIVFNSKSYTVDGEKTSYFNYPFNSLGADKYFPDNENDLFDKMQVVSPELDYYKPSLPNEMSLQGFIFGKSSSRVVPVEDHSKMVILGNRARRLANTLAILEVTTEIIIKAAEVSSNAQVWVIATAIGGGASVGLPAFIAAGVVAAIGAVEGLLSKAARYRFEWERTFENLGTPYNFGYYLTSGSNYNYLKTPQTEGNKIRGLSVGKYLKSGLLNISDTTSGKIIRVNNIDREEAPFFSLGNYPINITNQEYLNYDNSSSNPNFSSQVISSEIGCQNGKSPEQTRNIASPYVAFKNYIPNQYGAIGSIKWVDTTYCISIEETGVCRGILGGDTFISRHSKKRKARMFETDLLGQADLTPFPYEFYSNYGNPRFYIDYKVNDEFRSGRELFPSIFYDVRFDCNVNSGGFYVAPPGKFYLYNIGFANFLCETRINTNFRNARVDLWNQFYPQNTDYEALTQPSDVSLTRPESYFYNKAYLQTNVLNTSFTLPDYYSSEDESRRAYNKNTVMYSLPDSNENSITEPWFLYRPNDRATLESTYGDLIGLKGIESDQILMYFENALQLQNSINKFTDGSTQYNSDLGNGGIFAKRAITLRTTDLGYGGSQSKNTLSCEFGHFHADLKRGQVFNYVGGNNLQEISRYSNGRPNGMDVWFKEHLPLKILKYFPNFKNINNPYNGVGVHWGYDSKFRRVILTKKDYIPVEGVSLNYDLETNTFDNDTSLQQQLDLGNLKEVSWTLTYKPETGSWESYMSYTPNYYINHTDYFQSGVNSNDERTGLWSHLLSNKSFRVFYGQKFPYVIEYPIKNEYFSKRLESIDWNAQLRRYHNDYDYSVIEANPFTKINIYNNYECSGDLVPVNNNGTLSQLSKYPITNSNNTQDILISYDNYRYSANYFYNRVLSNRNNQPIWFWDENQINKEVNRKAVSFYGKKTLERLKGNFFTVRLERDSNTNYDLDFRWSEHLVSKEI